MAIEKFEFLNGTPVEGTGGSSGTEKTNFDRATATWKEGCRYIRQIADVLRASAIFDSIEEEVPPQPTSEDYTYVYTITGYKANCYIGKDSSKTLVLSVSADKFNSSSPSSYAYSHGMQIWLSYQSGNSTLNKSLGVGGTASANTGIDVAYATSNGVIFRCVFDRASSSATSAIKRCGFLMVAKSNIQYPMVMFTALVTNTTGYNDAGGPKAHQSVLIGNYKDYYFILSSGSSSTIPKTGKTWFHFETSMKQSVLVPFAGVGGTEKFTFTPKGFWIPLAPTAIREGGLQKMHIDGRNCVTDGYWALQDG